MYLSIDSTPHKIVDVLVRKTFRQFGVRGGHFVIVGAGSGSVKRKNYSEIGLHFSFNISF